jgi:hypothetical protein
MNMRPLATVNVIGGGPRDADLITRIGIAFTTRPRIAWHDIHVAVRDAIVTLRGDVPTVYDRQLIVAVTRHVAGVRLVDDKINVAEPVEEGAGAKLEPSSANSRNGDDRAADQRRHVFSHLPVVAESLEDILVRNHSTQVSE